MTRTSRDTAYTISSGNVFADLALPEPDTELIKADLAHAIALIIEERALTQTESAVLMGIRQPNVSLLMCGRTENYSVGRLLMLLNRLGHDVVIAHCEKPKSQPVGRTRVGVMKGRTTAVAEHSREGYGRKA